MSRRAPPSKLREQLSNDDESSNDEEDEVSSSPSSAEGDDDAVDDTEDLPDDFVHIQKNINCERRRRQSGRVHGIQDLLPFPFSPLIRPLTISDLESCVALESAAFPNPAHRCSRDKFIYRLTACPELCMGVFCTVVPSNTRGWEIDTLYTAHTVETGRVNAAVSVLLAHIVATRSHDDVVTDDAMSRPRDNVTARSSELKLGHQETGRTVCLHSLAVHPKLQGVGMGKLIVKAYMQQMKSSELADRVALICRET
ncbi:hypothetical protein EKO27_g332 [Xylaria grammica]|uniref:N-acetyltransferase domain-containing protein n=1 Tax=Xylaria grammica TaxID=363999 RepID=A0A439DK33_9PEZI|nr:hypothetical protein EKO27_g332 [Xylaria grammica]